MQRFPAIKPEDRTEAQRKLVEEIASGPRGGIRGPFLPLLHHPELAQHIQKLGGFLRYGTSIPTHLVELAVLMIARRWTCQFEWFAHAPIARKAGLAESVIEAVAVSGAPENMDADMQAVFDCCRELGDAGRLSDATFNAAAAQFRREGVLELVGICGYYTLLAFVLNVADDPLPDGAAAPLK